MSNDSYVLESGSSRCKNQLPELTMASTSDHIITADKPSLNLLTKDVLKRLETRLRVLEEESETLKEALSESVEERANLMSEIHQDFDTIQKHCLLQRQVNRPELYSHADRRAGLLQVLFLDSNPAIVYKGVRTKALG